MARKGIKITTKVSFLVTFTLPDGMNVSTAREHIKESLVNLHGPLKIASPLDIRVHLTNKEMSYGQR